MAVSSQLPFNRAISSPMPRSGRATYPCNFSLAWSKTVSPQQHSRASTRFVPHLFGPKSSFCPPISSLPVFCSVEFHFEELISISYGFEESYATASDWSTRKLSPIRFLFLVVSLNFHSILYLAHSF